ncbi:MAG: hypothetical protein Q9210_007334 [Variospora velana]
MPIKWSADKDQKLLLKILETSNITVDVKMISTNWSTDPGEEAPTPRAIQERIHKIRAMAKGKGTGSFKMTGTVGSQSSPSKVTKPRASPKKKNAKETTAEKRKRGGKRGAGSKEDSDADNISDASSTVDVFKTEGNGSDADDDMLEASPGKKIKAEEAIDGMMEGSGGE